MNRIKRSLNEGYAKLEKNLSEHMGMSKHNAKQEASQKGFPTNRLVGIYSFATLKTYKSYLKTFVRTEGPKYLWLAHISDYESLVSVYLQRLVDDYFMGAGYSPFTIGTIASALGATFERSKTSFGVKMPKRKSSEIRNSRKQVKSDDRYKNLDKYGDAFNVSLATGARKGGLIKLNFDDIQKNKFGMYEVCLDEKNGKKRCALVLPDFEEKVIEILKNPKGPFVKGRQRVFNRLDIPKGTHEWRAGYCMNLYRFYEKLIKEGKIKKPVYANGKFEFYCMRGDRKGEVFDRWILKMISKETGHGPNRDDLIANNYIRKGFGLYTLAYMVYNKRSLEQ